MAELCEDAPGLTLVTADGVHQGVPSVVSDAIDWAPAPWRANPDDAEDLVRVAQCLLTTPQAVDDGRTALTSHVTSGIQTWKAFLVP